VAAWLAVVVVAAGFLAFRANTEETMGVSAGVQLSQRLYVDPQAQAATWVQAHADSPLAEVIEQRIAGQPTAKWFGAWCGDITAAVSEYSSSAADEGKIPVLVAYNIPDRDCGGESAGGLASMQQYNEWIHAFARGLGGRQAIVILEPDSLAMLDNGLDAGQQQRRLAMLRHAVRTLQSDQTWVYLDAGHSNWVPAEEMARRLREAGIAGAHGFSLNVSNYNTTDAEVAYGKQVAEALGMPKPFVVDTSRNGNGARNGEWCNPAGSRIGPAPQAGGGAEMLLWLKAPGESDGDCGIGTGTAAGEFSPGLAHRLIDGR